MKTKTTLPEMEYDLSQEVPGITIEFNTVYRYYIYMYIDFRVVIDGNGARTVFNGHRPLFDQRWTLTNHYISGVCIKN